MDLARRAALIPWASDLMCGQDSTGMLVALRLPPESGVAGELHPRPERSHGFRSGSVRGVPHRAPTAGRKQPALTTTSLTISHRCRCVPATYMGCVSCIARFGALPLPSLVANMAASPLIRQVYREHLERFGEPDDAVTYDDDEQSYGQPTRISVVAWRRCAEVDVTTFSTIGMAAFPMPGAGHRSELHFTIRR